MPISVHDNHIVSYEVVCEAREVRLVTEYRYNGRPFERTIVSFSGVEAYHLEHDCMGNIIFDISKVPFSDILTKHLSHFEEGFRKSGWPRFWRKNFDEVTAHLTNEKIIGFELTSSYGMTGWFLAKEMSFVSESHAHAHR